VAELYLNPLREFTMLPRPIAGFLGPTSKGEERREGGKGKEAREWDGTANIGGSFLCGHAVV